MEARPPLTVGVIDAVAGDGPGIEGTLRALRVAVAVQEIGRRLNGAEIRAYTVSNGLPLCGLAGEVVQALAGPVDVDAGFVLGDASEWPSEFVQWSATAGVPDPLLLSDRLVSTALLESRREYLAVTGQIPRGVDFALCLGGGDIDVGSAPGAFAIVLRPAVDPGPTDLLGLVHAASAVVTSSPGVAAVAVALERPVTWRTDDRAPDRASVTAADRLMDDLCRQLSATDVPRPTHSAADRVAALERRLVAVESANAGLREALLRERLAMADEVRRRDGAGHPGAPVSSIVFDRLAIQLEVAEQDNARLRAEIDRIYATLVMRSLAPLRRAYGRLRRQTG